MNLRPVYKAPTIWSLDSEGVRELLGPVENAYAPVQTATGCLPIDAVISNTVQDNWQFSVQTVPTTVRITVDVNLDNAGCAALAGTPDACMSDTCAIPPDTGAGPLDPKIALYPPGVTPMAGPFNGHNAAECDFLVTGDTGCMGPGRGQSDCIVCDNQDCTVPPAGPPSGRCASFEVVIDQGGLWTLAIAPDPNVSIPQSQGCYAITIEGQAGGVVGDLCLVDDDMTVTFLPR